MNKAYRVVFNKARGALMVANELTSSVQKKGTKTVLAAAALAMVAAAGVQAAEEPTEYTYSNQTYIGTANGDKGSGTYKFIRAEGSTYSVGSEDAEYKFIATAKDTDGSDKTKKPLAEPAGVYVNESTYRGYKSGNLTINGKSLTIVRDNVKALDPNKTDMSIGIDVSTANKPGDKSGSKLTVNSKDTVIRAVADKRLGVDGAKKAYSVGISAMSWGQVFINGNLAVDAEDAILARGEALVNINESGTNTVKLKGNVDFNYNGENSGTPVDATVKIKLSDKDSYWIGRSYVTDDAVGIVSVSNDDKFAVGRNTEGLSLDISNGAYWEADGDSFVNTLTVSDGSVKVDDTFKVSVQKLTAKDAAFAIGKGASLAAETVESLSLKLLNVDKDGSLIAGDNLTLTGVGVNSGTVSVQNVKLESGASFTNTGIFGKDKISGKLIIEEGATLFDSEDSQERFGVTELRGKFVTLGATQDVLIDGGQIDLLGGHFYKGDENTELKDFKLGVDFADSERGNAPVLNVLSAGYDLNSIKIGMGGTVNVGKESTAGTLKVTDLTVGNEVFRGTQPSDNRTAAGTLNLVNGTVTTDALTVDGGTLTVTGGTLTVNTTASVKAGELVVSGTGSTVVDVTKATLSTADSGKFTVSDENATIRANKDSIFSGSVADATLANGLNFSAGLLEISGFAEGTTVTFDDIAKLKAQFGENNKLKISLVDAKVVASTDKDGTVADVTMDEVINNDATMTNQVVKTDASSGDANSGYTTTIQTKDATTSSSDGSPKEVTVQAILTDSNSTKVEIKSAEGKPLEFTLAGSKDGGALIKNESTDDSAKDQDLTIGANTTVKLGASSDSQGTLNSGNVEVSETNGKLEVAQGTFEAQDIVVKGGENASGGTLQISQGALKTSGTVAINSGANLVVDAGSLAVKELEVTGMAKVATGTVNAEKLTVNGSLALAGSAAEKAVEVAKVIVDELAGSGNVTVGHDLTGAADGEKTTGAGYLEIGKLTMTGGSLFLDSAWVDGVKYDYGDGSVVTVASLGGDSSDTLGTQIIVGQNSMAVIGASKDDAVTAAKETGKAYGPGEITAVLHVAAPVKLDDNGTLYVDGSLTSSSTLPTNIAKTVTLKEKALMTIDTDAIGSETVFQGATSVTVDSGAYVYLTNVKKVGDSITITDGSLSVSGDSILSLNKFVGFEVGTDGKVTAKASTATSGGTASDVIDGLYNKGMSSNTAKFFDEIGSDMSFTTSDGNGKFGLTAKGDKAVSEFSNAAAVAGVYNVAYDAQSEFTDSVTRHMLETSAPGQFAVWADVYGARTKAKTLYGDAGYSADVYGGVLGGDYTFACGAKAGFAITVGTADAESEGTVFKQSNDADYWGLSAYAAKDVGGLNVKADVGYLASKNDLKGKYANEKIDAQAWTFGLRGDFAAYSGETVTVTPHLGLRYTRIDADNLADRENGSINLVEAPVGVAVKANFDAAGWKVAPKFDLSVVPQLGDKDVTTKIGGVSVDSNVIDHALGRATLGVDASMGSFTFGLDYRYGFGNEDRSNHALKATARYAF